jgi:ATP-dependent DNA helicase RecG
MSEIKLTERQWNILKLIMESPTITAKQMSEIMSVNKRTVERDLTHLKKIGKLMREGSDKDGIWVVI